MSPNLSKIKVFAKVVMNRILDERKKLNSHVRSA